MLNYKALREMAKKEAKEECDLRYPPDLGYWQKIGAGKESELMARKYYEYTLRRL